MRDFFAPPAPTDHPNAVERLPQPEPHEQTLHRAPMVHETFQDLADR